MTKDQEPRPKEKPILFSGEMVRAILEGRKTQTRRVVINRMIGSEWKPYSYGQPGDRLWVRETFQFVQANSDGQRNTFRSATRFTQHDYRWIEYAATPKDKEPPPTWRPSIFMSRWACRLVLEIVRVCVERVQDITSADAKAEGVTLNPDYVTQKVYGDPDGGWRYEYRKLWDSLNAKRGFGWIKNPWVWVIEFKPLGPCAFEP